MAKSLDSRFLDDPEFQSLLVGCLESLQRGETIDRDALAKDFPKFAEEIGRFLEDRQLLEEAASDFGNVPPSRVAISAYANTMDSKSGHSDFSIGESIRYIGEYEVLEEIARGGMGVVFKARQQKLNRIVALKMILAGRLADKSDVERFYREARAAGRLNHPNIVPVHEIGEHDGRHYFTMNFVEGRSLADQIRDETLPPRTAAGLVQSVAEAVQYAHDQGTVHRDLKPGNVLLDQTGEAKVTDFGLAKMLRGVDDETRAELTASGQVLGTPSYMSPEQASGKQELVGPASDIYSLGAILYACLTGRAPFVADSPVDTLLQVMNKEPVSPRELNPSVPKDLETICLKCLTKEPHKRYGTAQELADDLNRFLEGRPVIARPVGRITKAARWCRRNKLVASLLTLAIWSLMTGTIVSSYFANSAIRLSENEKHQRVLAENARSEAERQRDAARKAQTAADRERQQALWKSYVARMQQASQVADAGDFGHLDRLLHGIGPEEGESDLRGWEWHFYRNEVDRRTVSLTQEQSFVRFHLHPTAPNLLFALTTDSVETWDFQARRRRSSFPISRAGIRTSVSPDGAMLASGFADGEVTITDLQTGKQVNKIESFARADVTRKTITGIAWDPTGSGDLAIACWRGDIGLWNARSGQFIRMIADSKQLGQRTDSLDWHPVSGLASGHQHGGIRVWDKGLKNVVWRKQFKLDGIRRLKWSPSGENLLADRSVWTRDGERLSVIDVKYEQSATAATWMDDTTVVVGDGHRVVMFDSESGARERTLNVHTGVISTVEFDSDGRLVSCARDQNIRRSVVASESRPGRTVSTGEGRILSLAWSPDDRRFAVSRKETNKAFVLDAQTLETAVEVRNPGPHQLHGIHWSKDGNDLFAIGYDGFLNRWDSASGNRLALLQTGVTELSDLALSPTGYLVALAGKKSMVYRYPELQAESQWQGTWNAAPTFAPDNRRLLLCLQGELIVVDLQDGEIINRKRVGDVTLKAQFSPDGQYCAVAGDAVYIFDGNNFDLLFEMNEHRRRVSDVKFSPTGDRLATAGHDGTLRIWDTANFDELICIREPNENQFTRLAWSHDGHRLLAGTDSGDIYYFDSSFQVSNNTSAKTVTESIRFDTAQLPEVFPKQGRHAFVD